MVRIIVGTVVDVGRGKIKAEDVPKIIESENRQNAGKTMDAKGLILKCVEY
jgi:tRNA pseudouridine38-40 synthase